MHSTPELIVSLITILIQEMIKMYAIIPNFDSCKYMREYVDNNAIAN